jgi:hypothetical protein
VDAAAPTRARLRSDPVSFRSGAPIRRSGSRTGRPGPSARSTRTGYVSLEQDERTRASAPPGARTRAPCSLSCCATCADPFGVDAAD